MSKFAPGACSFCQMTDSISEMILAVLIKSFKFDLPRDKEIVWNLGGIQTPSVKGAETQMPHLPLLVSCV